MTKKIKEHFKRVDPILFAYIEKIELKTYSPPENLFLELCESIISQQLSIKASDTIYSRFMKLFKGAPTPQKLLKIKDSKIRSCGISYGKIKYLKDLALQIKLGNLNLENLKTLPDEEVIITLTKIKGVGRWTAEMFLMFTLDRPDIFSHGDLGLRRGIQRMYGFKKEPTIKQIEKIVKKWVPYRTFGSRILWKSLESK